MPLNALLLSLSFIVFAGCATLNNQASQTVIATAHDPHQGIKIEVLAEGGAYLSSLPSTIVGRSSWSGITIKVVDPCYEPSSFEVPKSLTRSFWANLIFVYGFIVDPVTGYLFNYDDKVEVPVKRKAQC